MYRIIVRKGSNRYKVIVKPVQKNIAVKSLGPRGLPGTPGVGLPAGGEAGQVLAKVSGSDYDTTWTTPNLADLTYRQEFVVSDEVTVQHNLNKYPAVSVIDTAGDEVEGDVYYVDTSRLIVRFSAPFSGAITCN